MPLVVGIDEAGYGPTLGPLVIGATLWQVQRNVVKQDYWELLSDCVQPPGRRSDAHLTVGDSKKVYKRKSGLHTLERSVLAFASAAGVPCRTLDEFLHAIDSSALPADKIPWYRELAETLPLEPLHSKFDAIADRLQRTMNTAGVKCCGMAARIVDEQRFNRRVATTRNKAAVLIEQILGLIEHGARLAGKDDLVVRIDRLGGRSNYRGMLQSAFPERHLHEIKCDDTVSRYRLASGNNNWYIEFAVGADSLHLPVALASMLAKYVREALMQRFNAFWRNWLPALKPTAGYYTDAQRFLADINPVLQQSGLQTETFVRTR